MQIVVLDIDLNKSIYHIALKLFVAESTTDRTLIRAEEGPKVLAPPPTAYMAQANFSLAAALGGYNRRHCGNL